MSDEIPDFYTNQIERLDGNKERNAERELLELQLELENLKNENLRRELELKNGIPGEYENNIDVQHDRVDFEIIGGYIEKEIISSVKGKLKKGWIPQATVETKQKKYSLGYSQIIPSNEGPNRFIIELNSYNNGTQEIINIEYNGGRNIHIFGNRGEHSQTVTIRHKPSRNNRDANGFVEINTRNGKIILFLDLSRKRQNYNHRNPRRY